MKLALVGYRGSGKTAVARELSARLGCPWFDADEELEARAGRTIKQIFAVDGEAAFRDLEEQITAELLGRDKFILATGGGVILRAANRRRLQAAQVVWLSARPETLYARIHGDPTTASRRPNLTAAGGMAEIADLVDQRRPLYNEVSDYSVETDQKSPPEIADEILSLLGHTAPRRD